VSWFGSWYAGWVAAASFLPPLLFFLWLLSPSVREGLILAGRRCFHIFFLRLVLDPGVGSLFCILYATVALLGVFLFLWLAYFGKQEAFVVPLQDRSHVG
jgi:hypothetical protein